MNAAIDFSKLLPAWQAFTQQTDVAPIRNAAHYRRMTAMLDALLAQTGGDEAHPAMGLVDIVGDLVAHYEAKRHPLPEATGVQALRFLMAQHEVKQTQLPEVGSQGVVSEVLAGKREINVRQARALAQRFGVSTATFV